MSSSLALVLLLLAALTASCELIASADVYQCSSDGDCAARGGAFRATTCVARACVPTPDATAEDGDGQARAAGDPDAGEGDADAPSDSPWGCLGQVDWQPQSTTTTVLYRNRFVQLSSRTPVTGLQVSACSNLNPLCQQPVAKGVTDDQGYVDLTVPQWFRGFFAMATPPPSYPDMAPALLPALPPPSRSADPDAGIDVASATPLATSGELDAVLSVVGRQLPASDAGLGQLLGLTTDCQGNPAAGVSLEVSKTMPGETIPWYISSDGVPSTTDQQTSASGQCGFVDLPEGDDTVTMALLGQGQKVGQITLLIRSGFDTIALLGPTP